MAGIESAVQFRPQPPLLNCECSKELWGCGVQTDAATSVADTKTDTKFGDPREFDVTDGKSPVTL